MKRHINYQSLVQSYIRSPTSGGRIRGGFFKKSGGKLADPLYMGKCYVTMERVMYMGKFI